MAKELKKGTSAPLEGVPSAIMTVLNLSFLKIGAGMITGLLAKTGIAASAAKAPTLSPAKSASTFTMKAPGGR